MELLKATRHFHSNCVEQGGSHPSSLRGKRTLLLTEEQSEYLEVG